MKGNTLTVTSDLYEDEGAIITEHVLKRGQEFDLTVFTGDGSFTTRLSETNVKSLAFWIASVTKGKENEIV